MRHPYPDEIALAQTALRDGDIETVVDLIIKAAARESAERIKALRKDYVPVNAETPT